jgi:hypothetical protein
MYRALGASLDTYEGQPDIHRVFVSVRRLHRYLHEEEGYLRFLNGVKQRPSNAKFNF